jgi:hypothetical protein
MATSSDIVILDGVSTVGRRSSRELMKVENLEVLPITLLQRL